MTSTAPWSASTARARAVLAAGPADVDALCHLIAEAFFALPPSRWLIGDPAARRVIFPSYFRIYVEHVIADGVAYTTPDRDAAALWLPTCATPASPPGYDQRLAAVTGPWHARFAAFDAALDRHHPAGRAHHATLDAAGVPAYLEAATARTRRLYHRHGYVLRPDAPIRLPGGGPLMWPLWREPRQHPPAGPVRP